MIKTELIKNAFDVETNSSDASQDQKYVRKIPKIRVKL